MCDFDLNIPKARLLTSMHIVTINTTKISWVLA
jgi:hypothetical protein